MQMKDKKRIVLRAYQLCHAVKTRATGVLREGRIQRSPKIMSTVKIEFITRPILCSKTTQFLEVL